MQVHILSESFELPSPVAWCLICSRRCPSSCPFRAGTAPMTKLCSLSTLPSTFSPLSHSCRVLGSFFPSNLRSMCSLHPRCGSSLCLCPRPLGTLPVSLSPRKAVTSCPFCFPPPSRVRGLSGAFSVLIVTSLVRLVFPSGSPGPSPGGGVSTTTSEGQVVGVRGGGALVPEALTLCRLSRLP